MLDLRRRNGCVWDAALKPFRMDERDKEPFEAWWDRHQQRLSHLHPQVAEQWIYRHWSHSYMAFLELDQLDWRLETWHAQEILERIHLEFGGPMDAEHDYAAFNGRGSFGPIQTARALNAGEWDMPLLALETPSGLLSSDGPLPDVRYVVAEGSKRMRYLFALERLGHHPGPQKVFLLKTPQVT